MQDAKFFIYTADQASPKVLRGKLIARVHDGEKRPRHVLLDDELPLGAALEKALEDARNKVPLPEDPPEDPPEDEE